MVPPTPWDPETEAPWRDEDLLRELYVDEGLSKKKISGKLDCSDTTVGKWLERHGIEDRAEPIGEARYREEPVLRELYVEQETSLEDIADELECSHSTVVYWLGVHGIETRERHEKMVERLYEKPAYFYTSKRGYEMWAGGVEGEVKQVAVHRVLAIAEYGFDAVGGKDVHHKNGVPWDNRPENIGLLTRSEHVKRHWEEGNVFR